MLAADLFQRHERDRATPPDDRRRSVREAPRNATGVYRVRRRSRRGGQPLRVPSESRWYLNLVAHPIVTVEVSGERAKCRARSAEGRERELLYGRVGEQMPRVPCGPEEDATPDSDRRPHGIRDTPRSVRPYRSRDSLGSHGSLTRGLYRPGLSVCGRLKTSSACEARAPDPTTRTLCLDQSAVGCHKVGA